ncbi:zinc finger BED domain-containing protein RICESLEEPER 2-like [Papaver somniferum]|uniref:zinc finger BED domain-containing protein RICESLEEPER 2-like n=1 Tax=Papaver somniferum TaxID=3469 RepID=UPI000E6FBB45|nr:zinc finger BED domain-containing protein RICESLEEPER 2-like [Papaver somniferum]
MSSDGEDDDVEMLDSVNEDPTVGCAPACPAPVSRGKKNKLRSQVWEFFKLVKYKDGTKKGVCKACNVGYKYESQKGGTSAMKRHKCPNRQSMDVGKMILSANNGQLSTRVRKVDQMKLRDLFSALLIARNVPFALVEWKEFRDICTYLNEDAKLISRNTGKSDVVKKHKAQKEIIRNRLKLAPGRICLTSDMWTSVTTTGYISLTAHYLDQDWVLQKKLLNLCPLPPPHTGEHLSTKLFAMIEDWGIEDKSRLVAKKIFLNDGKFFHVRYCAHILALIVKEGLKKIDPAVIKIRASVKSLKKSQVRKQKFLDIVNTLGMSGIKRGIRQDVKTRWNSTYLMLDSCILYKPVFSHSKLVDSDYEDCPTDEEWEQIEVVTKFLKVFHDLTKIFSGSKYPTSNLYFERICQVQVLLKKESRNDIEFIRNMVKEMQAKFDSYWKELSPILAMAVVLDPRSKMNFVKFTYSKLYPEVRELEREVNEVRSNMTTLFNEYYTLSSSRASNSCATQNLGIKNGGNSAAEEGSDFFQEHVATQESGGDVLIDLSELDEYLGESYRGCLNSPLDILNYWKNHEQRFPEKKIWMRTMGLLKKMY